MSIKQNQHTANYNITNHDNEHYHITQEEDYKKLEIVEDDDIDELSYKLLPQNYEMLTPH